MIFIIILIQLNMDIQHENARVASLNVAVEYNTKLISHQGLLSISNNAGSFASLGKILKKKNEQFRQENQNKKLGKLDYEERERIAPKALELRKLTNKVKYTTKEHIRQMGQDLNKKEQMNKLNKQFSFPNLTENNQGNYLVAHSEYFIKKTMGQCIKNHKKGERELKILNLQKIKAIDTRHEASPRKKQTNQKQKKDKSHSVYLNFIKKIIITERGFNNLDELLTLNSGQLWKIINYQIKNYQQAINRQKPNPQIGIFLASIKLIQDLFKKNLLEDQKTINGFIQREYVDKSKERDYFYDNKHALRWGLAYCYYRAGSFPKFLSKISEDGQHGSQMRKAFEQLHQSIQQFNPRQQEFNQKNYSDPFYQQLMFILRGEVRISNLNLFNIDSLDFVWMILRLICLHMFGQDKKNKQNMIKKFLEKFEHHIGTNLHLLQQEETYKKLLYLNAYQVIISLHNSNYGQLIISDEFYLHLMIILYFHPQLLKAGSNQISQLADLIASELNKCLVSFISNTLQMPSKNQIEYAVYYMLLIPKEFMTQSFKKIFTKLEKFKKIDDAIIDGIRGWEYLEYKTQNNTIQGQNLIFYRAVQEVFIQLLRKEKDPKEIYEIVIKASSYFTGNRQFFYKFLIESIYKLMNLNLSEMKNSRRQKLFDKPDIQSDFISQCIDIIKRMDEQQKKSLAFYESQFTFIKSYKQLELLISKKDINSLIKFIENEQIINNLQYLLPEADRDTTSARNLRQIFKSLLENQCINLFEIYLANFITAVVEVNNRKGKYSENDLYKERMVNILKQINYDTEETQNLHRYSRKAQTKKTIIDNQNKLSNQTFKRLAGKIATTF